jgi:hypothetical protein
MTSNYPRGSGAQLCAYTGEVLSQMASVVQPYVGSRSNTYGEHVGAHLRHIIEHFDTLAHALACAEFCSNRACVVDYDARQRDPRLEADPAVALNCIALLQRAFEAITDPLMERSVDVHTRGGLQGQHNFSTRSSVARELMFLNSHATHHFAILQGYARQRGETLGAGIGKAPATVAYEQRAQQERREFARA